MTLLERFRTRDDDLDRPIEIDAEKLTPLGQHRGRAWFKHPKFKGELREWVDRLPWADERTELPNRPIAKVDAPDIGRAWRLFDLLPAGSFERMTAPKPASAPPSLPVSATRTLSLFRPRPEVAPSMLMGGAKAEATAPRRVSDLGILGTPRLLADTTHERPVTGEARADTPERMLARFKRKNVGFRLTPDGRVFLVAERGRIGDDVRDAWRVTSRLLTPLITGASAALCEANDHDGRPPAAIDVLLADVLVCADCRERIA